MNSTFTKCRAAAIGVVGGVTLLTSVALPAVSSARITGGTMDATASGNVITVEYWGMTSDAGTPKCMSNMWSSFPDGGTKDGFFSQSYAVDGMGNLTIRSPELPDGTYTVSF